MNWIDWLSVVGSASSILAFLGISLNLTRRYKLNSPSVFIQEFWLFLRRPWHAVMSIIAVASTTWIALFPSSSFPRGLVGAIPFTAMAFLVMSLFLIQSRQVTSAIVVRQIARLAGQGEPEDFLCAVIRFDIDRLKAVSNYSISIAEGIRAIVEVIVMEESDRLRRQGRSVCVLPILGEDETVVIATGLSDNDAADFADAVRRRVKLQIASVPYYEEAVRVIRRSMHGPPDPAEEATAIGTVSAGVSAYRGNEEMAFSNASAAVKESKVRGRNKTVILRPGSSLEVRGESGGSR